MPKELEGSKNASRDGKELVVGLPSEPRVCCIIPQPLPIPVRELGGMLGEGHTPSNIGASIRAQK